MKLFQSMRTKKMFYRILALLLSMAAIMFLMVFLFMHFSISQSYERRVEESAQQLLGTADEYVELAVLDLGRAMQQLLWNTDVTGAILVPDEVSYSQKVEIAKALSTFEQDHPLVERVCLLTYANQTLYDDTGSILPMKEALQRGFLSQFNSSVWGRTVGDGEFSTRVLTVDGAVALLQDFPTPEQNGALLMELREDVLLHFLEESLGGTGAYMEVLAPSGGLIYSIGTPDGASGPEQRHVGQADWTFLLRQAAGQTRLTGAQVLQLIGLWALLFGAVSVTAAVLITRSIYRPIRDLRSAVADIGTAGNETELDVVRRVYETTLEQKASLSRKVAEMAPIVRDRLYKNLLRGRVVSEDYLLDRLAYVNSPFRPDGLFAVMVGTLRESFDGSSDELIGHLYQRLSQTASGGEGGRLECVLMDDYSLVLLLAFDINAPTAQVKSAELAHARAVQEFARQSHTADVLVLGMGKQCRGLLNLHYSYQEALEDLNYRLYHGDSSEALGRGVGSDCRQILEMAMSGDPGSAGRAIEILLQEIRQEQPDAAQVKSEYSGIIDRMVETLLGLNVPEEKLNLFEPYYQQAGQLEGRTLEALLLDTAVLALNLLSYYGQKNSNRYVAQAQKYIRERCVDSRLSLDMVAENVGINSAYLSRLFYELSDVNFVNYVNGCRVEHAKLLLRQSKIPVQEVGFCSGFNSLQNFNRVFKRHTGTTPGAYRKQETETEAP